MPIGLAVLADPALPAEGAAASTDTRARTRRRQHAVAVVVVLLGEAVQAGHGHHARGDAVRLEQLGGVGADVHLGAGADQDQVGRRPSTTRAARRRRGRSRRPGISSGFQIGRPWRLSTSAVGVSLCSSAKRQASAVSFASAGRTHVDVRRGAQVGQLLHRLVGRPVLAEADRVVRVDEDRRQVHQRRQPDRGLHVVEEVEERGAERAQPVQARGRSRSPPCRARARRSARCGRL